MSKIKYSVLSPFVFQQNFNHKLIIKTANKNESFLVPLQTQTGYNNNCFDGPIVGQNRYSQKQLSARTAVRGTITQKMVKMHILGRKTPQGSDFSNVLVTIKFSHPSCWCRVFGVTVYNLNAKAEMLKVISHFTSAQAKNKLFQQICRPLPL